MPVRQSRAGASGILSRACGHSRGAWSPGYEPPALVLQPGLANSFFHRPERLFLLVYHQPLPLQQVFQLGERCAGICSCRSRFLCGTPEIFRKIPGLLGYLPSTLLHPSEALGGGPALFDALSEVFPSPADMLPDAATFFRSAPLQLRCLAPTLGGLASSFGTIIASVVRHRLAW
jgi:hypothetical protein